MEYDMPLYRPPSEAYSLIIQVTLGCSHNKCTFCSMYKSKKFKIKPLEVIKNEIDIFRRYYKHVEKNILSRWRCIDNTNGEIKRYYFIYKRSFSRV